MPLQYHIWGCAFGLADWGGVLQLQGGPHSIPGRVCARVLGRSDDPLNLRFMRNNAVFVLVEEHCQSPASL